LDDVISPAFYQKQVFLCLDFMHVLDLFSGIGGFSYGLEQAGFTPCAFCEIDLDCQAVLQKHWPCVPIYSDIRTLTARQLEDDQIASIQVICGGFPCQDVSVANPKGKGILGPRSGLWSEFKRLIAEIQPRYALIENVSALRAKGLTLVLQDLSAIGYDAEWHCIPASALGAPHRRDRIWIIAYPARERPSGFILESADLCPAHPTALHQFGDTSVPCGVEWQCDIRHLYVGDGIPARLARWRVKALGNAIVPLMAKIMGKAVMRDAARVDQSNRIIEE
jgi:DNA (cytosine-5)-methyltransferase 1